MPRGSIVVVGSSNTDMYILVDRLPAAGETVVGGDFETKPGGKGANQAVAAARAGSEVALVANLGTETLGRDIAANLQKERVSIDYVTLDRDHPTGVAMIMVDSSGENIIAVAPGANHALTEKHVEKARRRIEQADFLLVQMEVPREVVDYAVNLAYREDTRVMLNAAPAPSGPLPEELLRKVDVLIVNESEAKALTGLDIADDTSAERAARALKAAGAAAVVLTMGARGALVALEQVTFIPAHKVDAVDTVGAGDAFCGALVTALSEGMELIESAKFASAAAALASTKLGAQSSLPARTDIESFLRR